MKNKIKLAAILFLGLVGATFAQTSTNWSDWNQFQRYPGYVIEKGSTDTIKGFVEYNNAYDNQEECIFFKDKSDKKTKKKYKPEDLVAYGINGLHYRPIYYSGGLTSKKLCFLIMWRDGGIGTYKWWYEGKETDVYAKINDPKTVPHTQDYFVLKYKSKMAEFVADYPELSKKIADGEKGYGMMKLFDIFDEYNKWYANGKK